ncbi:MAG: hypothetical protein ACR2MS_06035 [Weeksellaceae bacterium]
MDYKFSTVREEAGYTEHLLVNDKVHYGRAIKGGHIGVLFFDDTKTQMAAMVRYKLVDVVPSDWETLNNLPEGGKYCVPFSLNSFASGAGAELLNTMRMTTGYDVVTFSPKSERVAEFHLNNGAELYAESSTCKNYRYGVWEEKSEGSARRRLLYRG